jgi:hypothetical protein
MAILGQHGGGDKHTEREVSQKLERINLEQRRDGVKIKRFRISVIRGLWC